MTDRLMGYRTPLELRLRLVMWEGRRRVAAAGGGLEAQIESIATVATAGMRYSRRTFEKMHRRLRRYQRWTPKARACTGGRTSDG